MQGAPVNGDRITSRDVKVCQVSGEEEIVALNGGTEEQGRAVPQAHHKLGKMPRAVAEQTVLTHSARLHIAKPVEDGKHRTVLQDPDAIVTGR